MLGEAGDVVGGADRGVHDGADAGLDAHADAGEAQRHHDVGEEDGGVDAVAAHRLEGDLGGEGRVEAGVEHGRAGALAQGPVLGQGAARLSHEPDGRARLAVGASGEGLEDRGSGHGRAPRVGAMA